jgi:soluble lytic murein transglycosylase-like protein
MAVQTKSYRKRASAARDRQATQTIRESVKSSLVRFLPGWILIGFVLVILLPNALTVTLGAAGRAITQLPKSVGIAPSYGSIAPMFTPSVAYWSTDIAEWAARYDLDPNLLATIMQIESCGDSTVSSYAGAQGLFQVMPFHFEAHENQLDPDTNAMRGANFLNQCLGWAEGNTGLAMACYNGGPSVLNKSFAAWPAQTQRYYRWGTTIYEDAVQNKDFSDSLQTWLDAGGSSLCRRASNTLGIRG